MNTADIIELYRFNEWANERLLGAAGALPGEALARDLGGSFRSIRDVLAHVASVEWVWLERWRGVSPSAIPDWAVSGDLPALLHHLADVQTRRAMFFAELSDSTLLLQVAFRYISGTVGSHPLHDLLIHVVNHSTYHRGQVASMLRQVGTVPPPTDFIVFKASPLGSGSGAV